MMMMMQCNPSLLAGPIQKWNRLGPLIYNIEKSNNLKAHGVIQMFLLRC
jgi:hypothetical protein